MSVLGQSRLGGAKLQVQPCPQCLVSDARPEKGGLSRWAMNRLMRCNKQRTSFDSRPSMRETQAIIDEQLRDVGWEADTGVPSISCAVKGRNFAIAEWPTASGPADRRGE